MKLSPKILTPLVVAGPSAVGKGLLIRTFLKEESHRFEACLSYTTRSIRKEEKEGVDYYFISKQEFEGVKVD
jgi:guanylate kinase